MTRGRQLRVYLHPADRSAVEGFVRSELESVLLLERSPDRDGFAAEDSTDGGLGRLICPASLVAELTPRFIAVRDEWILDVHSDPLVEWWFSVLDDGVLYPGRFYYVPPGAAIGAEKSAEFLRIATGLFRWVKKNTVSVDAGWGPERLGAVAAQMREDGSISLRRNPPGSRI